MNYQRAYFIDNNLRWYAGQTLIISSMTWLIAKNRAWTAGHWQLYHISFHLSPTLKSAIGMSGSPYAYHFGSNKRCQVHISRIHRHHHIKMTHQRHFGSKSIAFFRPTTSRAHIFAPTTQEPLAPLSLRQIEISWHE